MAGPPPGYRSPQVIRRNQRQVRMALIWVLLLAAYVGCWVVYGEFPNPFNLLRVIVLRWLNGG
jgi:hypothetical protein